MSFRHDTLPVGWTAPRRRRGSPLGWALFVGTVLIEGGYIAGVLFGEVNAVLSGTYNWQEPLVLSLFPLMPIFVRMSFAFSLLPLTACYIALVTCIGRYGDGLVVRVLSGLAFGVFLDAYLLLAGWIIPGTPVPRDWHVAALFATIQITPLAAMLTLKPRWLSIDGKFAGDGVQPAPIRSTPAA